MPISTNIYGPVTVYSIALEEPTDANSRADARRRERAAVEVLVRHAFGPDERLGHRADGSPLLEGHPDVCVSVSHSTRMAALAVADVAVGIDIEEPRAALLRVGPRFLTEAERALYPTLADLLRAWTLKEAAFKALRPGTPATEMLLPPERIPYTIVYSGPHPDAALTHLSVVISST